MLFLQNVKPHIIIGTETWLSRDILDSEIIPDEFNYTIYRKDRIDGYGGVLIAVTKDILSNSLPELDTSCEIIWCKIHLVGIKDLYACAYYRPHVSDQHSLDQLNISLAKVQEHTTNPTLLLAGDFNAPDIDWQSLSVKSGSSYSTVQTNLIDITQDYGFTQVVMEPTRLTNILDLFFTTNPSQVKKAEIQPGLSDHEMVLIQLNCKPITHRQTPRQILLFNRSNWDAITSGLNSFHHDLLNVDITNVDVNTLWTQFRDALLDLIDNHIPCKIARKKCGLPWVTREIRSMIRKRNRLYSMYKSSNSPVFYECFKSLKRDIQKKIRLSHLQYISSLISSENDDSNHSYNNNKKFWAYIKSLRKDNPSIPPLSLNGTEISDSLYKSDVFNNYFKSVFTIEDLQNLPDKGPSPHPDIDNITISSFGIFKLLNKLNINKATGPDHIGARILKETSSVIAPILRIIFQRSLDTGTIPEDWKVANIVPIHKKNDRSNPVNYRPISLTCITSKIFERILASHIMQHLESNNILYDLQHGFRQNQSCETQLIQFIHELMSNHDKNIQSDIILMDFAKAFDKVPHKRLLYKLHWYGIRGSIHHWIQSFLSNRTQRVIIDGILSSPVSVTSGVPQGTVLGPLLFLVYINDLPDYISHSTIRLFADDCILHRPIQNEHDSLLLQEDIDSLYAWTIAWQMELNIAKCCSMHITLSQQHKISHTYHIHNTQLSVVNQCKYLGIVIQSDLRWNSHVDQITAKANQTLAMLKRNIKLVPSKIKDKAYKSLVRPKLEFASSVWAPWQQFLINKIENIQRRAARFVVSDYNPFNSITQHISNLNWETLEDRRNKSRLCMFYKMTHNQAAIPYQLYIQRSTYLSSRHSNSMKFLPLSCNKNSYKQSFFPNTIPQWNCLSSETIDSPSLSTFKSLISNNL